MPHAEHLPFAGLPDRTPAEMLAAAQAFREQMATRRTVRDFANRPVPPEVIQECVIAAGQAPSGANLQPWHFEVVGDPDLKHQIRLAAEQEERAFYEGRAANEKPFLLLVVGHPASGATVPDIHRKAPEQYIRFRPAAAQV